MATSNEAVDVDVDVLVVGAGFGGIYSVWKFRNLGFRVHLFEAGTAFGGVWHHNSYPGARVDTEWPLYQLSIPEVFKSWNYTERFPGSAELREYFEHADRVLNIRKDSTFNAEVVGAQFDESAKTWTVCTKQGHRAKCQHLILCTGSTYRRYTPDFPNMSSFRRPLHHTSLWPKEGLDVKGKKVSVIGAGATGVQVVQEFAKEAKELVVFIRTPNVALPLQQRKVTVAEQTTLKGLYEQILRVASRNSFGGMPYNTGPAELGSPEEREAIYEELYQRGGFNLLASSPGLIGIDPVANRALYDFWAKKTRARMKNPVKREVLVPLEPRHPIMTKRNCLETDYYECLDQDNVRIVDLTETPIESFTERGIKIKGSDRTAAEEIESDAIVLATGYDNYTGAYITMGLKDNDGIDLKDHWKNGVQTYLGLMCKGYPNMYLVYGPHAPTALGNGPVIIETQIDVIADAIVQMRETSLHRIEPTSQAAQEWTADIHATAAATLFSQADSWYMGANVPGKKREMLNYLKGLSEWERSCRDALDGWKGFSVD